MAQCKLCHKKGIFLSVNHAGLCAACGPVVEFDVQQRARVITESDKIVRKSKNWKTRLSRVDVVLEDTTYLWEKYEQRGIFTFDPPPSEVRAMYLKARAEIIVEAARSGTEKALTKAELAATATSRINAANRAIPVLNDLREELDAASPEIDELEAQVHRFVHRAKLESYLEAARKAEFKGNKKKALDQFQEALYFLKTDEIDDSLQRESISEIEGKVAELQEDLGG